MKILLSPAKNIDLKKAIKSEINSHPYFMNESESLIKKLKKFSSNKIKKMMSVSLDIAELNHERYQVWENSIEKSEFNGQAAAIFNGEVYRGLDALTMNKKTIEKAQNELRILSGLYGILKPMDQIYAYRLEMGTRWAVTPAKKNLYQFWGSKITDYLNEEEQDLIVNLASSEYFKVINFKKIKSTVITPVFKEFKNGEYKIVMVYAKQARGRMARYLLDNDIKSSEEIKLFNVDGYQFDANLSTENEFVFTR